MELIKNLYWYPEMGMMDCNKYLITGETSVLIDPGATTYIQYLLEAIREDGIDPGSIDLILNTHIHPDHSGGNKSFRNETGAKFIAYEGATKQYSSRKPERYFNDNLDLGNLNLKIYHTPGHSPESICLYWAEEKILISGDLIFLNGIGRTDFRGEDPALIKDSSQRMSKQDIDYILPSHGEAVWGEVNVKKNFDMINHMYLNWM